MHFCYNEKNVFDVYFLYEGGGTMYKIIIIDDEEKIAEGIAHLFPWEQMGFSVEEYFQSGRKAEIYLIQLGITIERATNFLYHRHNILFRNL